jgi:hypothetical protein
MHNSNKGSLAAAGTKVASSLPPASRSESPRIILKMIDFANTTDVSDIYFLFFQISSLPSEIPSAVDYDKEYMAGVINLKQCLKCIVTFCRKPELTTTSSVGGLQQEQLFDPPSHELQDAEWRALVNAVRKN